MDKFADVVICGAGIAGVSAAYFLSVEHGITNLVLIDKGSPLSLTSDHSTECYRNWWPGPGSEMVELMNRSIAIIDRLADQSGNTFNLNRRGYLYLTADKTKIPEMIKTSEKISNFGAGPIRIHSRVNIANSYIPSHPSDYDKSLGGADLFLAPDLIHKHFTGITNEVVAALHVRKAGWLSAQQLGMYLLNKAKQEGIEFLQDCVVEVVTSNNQVSQVILESGIRINTGTFIIAAGPYMRQVCNMVGVELPVHNELHLKVALQDTENIVDRNAPLLIWMDPQKLSWAEDERTFLVEEGLGFLLEELPGGVHTRPEGHSPSKAILMLWEYNKVKSKAVFPIPIDPIYPEIVLRGICRMLPDLGKYKQKMTRPRVDGGYYTKTPENLPLIGKLPVAGAYVIGAFSGFGIMVACGSGDLLASIITNTQLPAYAPYFSPHRYHEENFMRLFDDWVEFGQL